MGNMFGECHAPCTLKTSFVDFRRVGALLSLQKTKLFVPTKLTILFQWKSTVIDTVDPSRSPFLLYYWTCSRPEYGWHIDRWTFSQNQSRNQATSKSCALYELFSLAFHIFKVYCWEPVGYIKPNCASMWENSQQYSRVVDNQEMCQTAVTSI